MALFEPIFEALSHGGGRYVVVGGVAVVLHGHVRLTADLDLVVDLEPEAARRTVEVFEGLGLVPRAPVAALDFAVRERREEWIREKGITVFSLFDPRNPLLAVDLFVDPPLPFEELWERSEVMRIGGAEVRVASISDLVRMKRAVGRPRDLEDVERLREIEQERERSDD